MQNTKEAGPVWAWFQISCSRPCWVTAYLKQKHVVVKRMQCGEAVCVICYNTQKYASGSSLRLRQWWAVLYSGNGVRSDLCMSKFKKKVLHMWNHKIVGQSCFCLEGQMRSTYSAWNGHAWPHECGHHGGYLGGEGQADQHEKDSLYLLWRWAEYCDYHCCL